MSELIAEQPREEKKLNPYTSRPEDLRQAGIALPGQPQVDQPGVEAPEHPEGEQDHKEDALPGAVSESLPETTSTDTEPFFDANNAAEPYFDESSAVKTGSLSPWQEFIKKRREKFSKGADTQGVVTSDNHFTFVNDVPQAEKYASNLGTSAADGTLSPAENKNVTEAANINTMKEEALVDALVKIKGIGEKTAMYLVAQIVELRGETVDKRGNTLPPVTFESAADFKANLLGVGTKKANEMARFFNLPEIATEENPETPEQEAADEADLNQRAEGWQEKAKRAVDAVKTGVFSIFQKTGQISADRLGQLAAKTKSVREVARRATDISHGIGAMESAMNMGISNMEKPWEYSENGDVDSEHQKERSLVKGFLEKLSKLKLSEKQKTMLRDKAAASLAVGVAGLLTTGLLVSLHSFKPSEATQINQVLTENVIRMPVPAHNWMDEKLPPEVQAQLEANAAPQIPQAEVLREPGVDRPSEPAAEITQAQNTEDVLAALDAPVPPVGIVSPAIAPDAATAFNAPPMPDMGSTIAPNEATAYKAPEVTNSAVAETTSDEKVQLNVPVNNWMDEKLPPEVQAQIDAANVEQPTENAVAENQVDASLGTAASQSEVRLFMPTLGERFAAPIPEAKSAEGVKKDGILYQQRADFMASNQELTDDAAAWNAFVNLYVRFNPNTNWNAIIPGQTTFEEFNSLQELNKIIESGGNATLNPQKEVEVYTALQNPGSVTDEGVREIAQKLRDTTIKPTNMTVEELETFLGYFLEEKAETPAN